MELEEIPILENPSKKFCLNCMNSDMSYTIEEVSEYLAEHHDPVEILELLDVDSEQLANAVS